jgi:hypothetical protein
VADGVDQCLAQRDGRVLRYLLPDQPAYDGIAPHLVVDPLIGSSDEDRKWAAELALLA